MNSKKTTAATSSLTRINLISMPWPLFNRPSIQLGVLKSYLETKANWIAVDTSHPYLEVASILGTGLYHWICQNTWVSESLYGPLLFPEKKKSSEALATDYASRADATIKEQFNYNQIHEKLEIQLKNWVNSCDWSQYKIVGFSVCFHQLLASLAAARAIKKKFPHVTIVFGGSSCVSAAGRSILDAFDFVDFVIQSEGEKDLLKLCEYISGRIDKIPRNIFSAKSVQVHFNLNEPAADSQLPSLDALPVPDYTDYFSDQKKWFPENPFIPVIPVEFSRGCWWNKCAFCNLNLQWCGYRYKKASQMIAEVSRLSAMHGCLDFTFTDNMIPPQESLHFFRQISALHSDFSFFAEIRPVGEKKSGNDIFSCYRSGGLSIIQVGIEALSTSLLKKMQKGISVIENIATMRAAHEHAIKLEGNLIIHFPGSTQSEVDETLENLDYVFPYSPLTNAAFFLGHDSPVYLSPEKFGIKAILNHANNIKLFPKEVLEKLNLIVRDYRGDRSYQKKIWRPVLAGIKKWQKYHEKRKISAHHKPLLCYRDGGDFLLIRQELIDGTILNHRLKKASRQIYLFCTRIRTDNEIFEEFTTLSQQEILAFLADLKKKRLVFSDKNQHLALAVHSTS